MPDLVDSLNTSLVPKTNIKASQKKLNFGGVNNSKLLQMVPMKYLIETIKEME